MKDSVNMIESLIFRGMYHILTTIFDQLNTVDSLQLASTNSVIRWASLSSNKKIRELNERSCFNLDLFPGIISKEEIQNLFFVLPDLRKLKVDTRFVEGDFLLSIKKFESLEKLSLVIYEYKLDNCEPRLSIKSLTLRTNYYTLSIDTIYNFLSQVTDLQKFSVYNGRLSSKAIRILNNMPLRAMKLHNTLIECIECHLVFAILNNRNLEHLKITCDNYIRFPSCFRLIENILNLAKLQEMPLKRLIITLDPKVSVKYENIIFMKQLKELIICYSVRSTTFHLYKLAKFARAMPATRVKVVEFLNIPFHRSATEPNSSASISMRFRRTFNVLKEMYSLRNFDIAPIHYEQWTNMN